ncbi:MAG: hypothetical protein U1F43_01140 [Myxococcota bacterium]
MLSDLARERAAALAAAHDGVRSVGRKKPAPLGSAPRVEPYLPPDTLGVFAYLPVIAGPSTERAGA